MLEIKSPITGERLQVAENDFENEMNWYQAKSACNDLGNGWRLPTKSELELMYNELHLRGKGNFKNSGYWSSTEHDHQANDFAWIFNYFDGNTNVSFSNLSKAFPYFIRAVRALPLR
jgi:hypothetical protein